MAPTALNTTPKIHALLKDLHNKSLTQESTLSWPTLPARCTTEWDNIMRDKFIALDQDKCELVYHILRSINATNVVEAGTSFGVSTIYLALAVAENAKRASGQGKGMPRVIATEKEETKATIARGHWAAAGKEVEEVIELRVGDLRETLTEELGVVDFLLLDSMFFLPFLPTMLCRDVFLDIGLRATYQYPFSYIYTNIISLSLDAPRPPRAEVVPAVFPSRRGDHC
jgi:hypothetical protein